MEKFTNFDDFINRVLGKSIDIDKAYGPQCVDLFNYFNYLYNDDYINCSPSGYAKSIAQNKANNGILKYYKEVPINQMVKGTVVVWKNCRYAPLSHVGFIISDNGDGTFQCLAQNSPKPYVTISKAYYDGIIGCFTPNQIINQLEQEILAREENERRIREEQERLNQVNQTPNLSNVSKERLLQEVIKVINGDYGDGHINRESRIGLGHEVYEEIRRQVNLNEKYGTLNDDNIKLY